MLRRELRWQVRAAPRLCLMNPINFMRISCQTASVGTHLRNGSVVQDLRNGRVEALPNKASETVLRGRTSVEFDVGHHVSSTFRKGFTSRPWKVLLAGHCLMLRQQGKTLPVIDVHGKFQISFKLATLRMDLSRPSRRWPPLSNTMWVLTTTIYFSHFVPVVTLATIDLISSAGLTKAARDSLRARRMRDLKR